MHPFATKWNADSELYPEVAEIISGKELVLDVGCGDGTLVDYLSGLGHTVIGVDNDLAVLPAGGEGNCKFADATNLPFQHHTFDAVVTVMTLHYHPVPALALAEMMRVVRRDGVLVAVGTAADSTVKERIRAAKDALRLAWMARGKTPWSWSGREIEPSLSWAENKAEIQEIWPGASFERVGSHRFLAVWQG